MEDEAGDSNNKESADGEALKDDYSDSPAKQDDNGFERRDSDA